jgi:hypothetical protein
VIVPTHRDPLKAISSVSAYQDRYDVPTEPLT